MKDVRILAEKSVLGAEYFRRGVQRRAEPIWETGAGYATASRG